MLKPRPVLQQVATAADQCAVLNTPESRRVRHYTSSATLTVNWRTRDRMNKPNSVAAILERERETTVKEWLRRVNLLPTLTHIPLSDEERTLHLPNLFGDLVRRLRLAEGEQLPISTAATEHGRRRKQQGYSPDMLVEESRVFQVVTVQTLHLHQAL